MNLELNKKQLRRLLDLVYIGNWILNSTRGDQRFKDYDDVESLLFARAALEGMPALAELYQGEIIPSIANYFGITIDELFGYENNREQKIQAILEKADREIRAIGGFLGKGNGDLCDTGKGDDRNGKQRRTVCLLQGGIGASDQSGI